MKRLPIIQRIPSWLKPHSLEVLANVPKDGVQRFCTYPFRLLAIASNYVRPCTWLREISGVSVISLENLITSNHDVSNALVSAWRSKEFNTVRESIRNGSYIFCDMKNCPEYHGDQKHFMSIQELKVQYPDVAKFIEGGSFDALPEKINVAYDPDCNLSCPSCSRRSLPKLSEDVQNKFSEGIKLVGSDLNLLHFVGMGDPFGTKHYYEFLKNLNPADYPKLQGININTNAIKFTPETWNGIPESVRKFFHVVIVSMDGVSKDSFEINRYPAKWDVFVERMKFISELRNTNQIGSLQLYYVYQINNYKEMPDAVRFAKAHNVDSIFFARIRDWNNWGEEKMNTLDVNRVDHPNHNDFKRISKEVLSMNDGIEIIIMD